MGKALYRKYRSRSLDEIVGQPHITSMLKHAIDHDTLAHAYLLTGPRGVGKTSIARILAHEINHIPYKDESTHLDIIEIDAASNNSVEDIRDLRDKVQIAPVSAIKKIYIIDEVHMLSKSAFNALLKTLEEPPEHVVFILATTDADKLPATILSRVQRFNFRLIGRDDVVNHLRMIADAENIDIEDEALNLIARCGQGSFRDSISLLDQMQHISESRITRDLVEQSLGFADQSTISAILDAYEKCDIQTIADTLRVLENRGIPAQSVSEQLIDSIRDDFINRYNCISLVDRLLSNRKTLWPYIELLVALTPKDYATVANSSAQKKDAPTKKQSDIPKNENVTAKKEEKSAVESSTKDDKTSDTPEQKKSAKKTKQQNKSTADFNWEQFLELIHDKAPGAHSFLVKDGYEIDENTLTIFAGKKFAKTQIEKALPILGEALQTLGFDLSIVVEQTAKPPKNKQTADILDIMGGGEEVKL